MDPLDMMLFGVFFRTILLLILLLKEGRTNMPLKTNYDLE